MRSLLDALQEGRLVELPDSNKNAAMEFLALLIEAIPDIGTKTDLVKAVQDREAQFNTGIGKGVAVPHCRVSQNGELLCAVGWSPGGIDYSASDGQPVHLVILYYVPDHLRHMYLREISGLAKVLNQSDSIGTLSTFTDIHTVRDFLLDWVSQAIDASGSGAKARMIKLDAKQALIEKDPSQASSSVHSIPENIARFIPFKFLHTGTSNLILSADKQLVERLEQSDDFGRNFNAGNDFTSGGYRIVILTETAFSHNRKLVDAVAYKT